jgi:hypothetical protein
MMNGELELLTGLSEKERMKIFTWLGTLSDEVVIKIIQQSVRKSYQLKSKQPSLEGKIVKYCSIIVSARQAGWDSIKGKGYRIAGDDQFEDFAHLRKAAMDTIVRKGRSPVIRKKVLAYWGEVKEFKTNGLGFRPIADYLLKQRKIKVSATYLKILWKEIEENGDSNTMPLK